MGWEDMVATSFKLGDGQNISLAVFNLKTAGSREYRRQPHTGLVRRAQGSVCTTVISNDDITAMLQLEGEKQSLKAPMTRRVCLKLVVPSWTTCGGPCGQGADSFVIPLRLINPNEAKVENRLVESFKGQEATLLSAMKFAGWALLAFLQAVRVTGGHGV